MVVQLWEFAEVLFLIVFRPSEHHFKKAYKY